MPSKQDGRPDYPCFLAGHDLYENHRHYASAMKKRTRLPHALLLGVQALEKLKREHADELATGLRKAKDDVAAAIAKQRLVRCHIGNGNGFGGRV